MKFFFILYGIHNIKRNNKMQTRSQTKQKYSVEIDFDGAIQAWRANKKLLPNCCYQYICGVITISGKRCCRKPVGYTERCAMHVKK